MHQDRSAGRTAGRLGAAVTVCLTLLPVVGCSAGSGGMAAEEPGARASAAAPVNAKDGGGPGTASTAPTAASTPEPAALAQAQVNIADGRTVGVGMPISVTFPKPVPAADRKAVESLLRVQTSTGTTGAWSWVKDQNLRDGQRVDFRPKTAYWQPGTKVTLHVGAHAVQQFTIGRSLIASVDVDAHMMTVRADGRTTHIPVTTGRPGLDTWNGTMVVMDKAPKVHMDSRTVGLGDAYNGDYFWAVHLTTSGTYVHQNERADTEAGHHNVTHGCVGLATDGTARKFYDQIRVGDVVTVSGGKKDIVATGNGYGDWNLTWEQWLARSSAGETATA
ncbi:Ig-like domain-containing protein [Streptomyces xanthochromogenes]|uniref:L,D-transpeptidase n=1 Tax=Streptomyces xanthochromogenes TaxID=67384 RepID=UPI0037A2DAA4